MLFDDLFYPDNKIRREQVAKIRAEIVLTFRDYKSAWNETATLLNDAFSQVKDAHYSKIRIPLLKKNIDVDTVGDCIKEIQTASEDAKQVLDSFVMDIGMDQFLPGDWRTNGFTLDKLTEEGIKTIGKVISSVVGGGLALYIGYYIFKGVATMSVIVAGVTGAAVSVGALVGGALAGAVVGGVVFVITDLIVSAIMGALERRELNEAIDTLKSLQSKISPCLNDATVQLKSIANNIRKEAYVLDGNYLLYRDENGNYVIIKFRSPKITAGISAVNLDSFSIQEKIVFISA